MTPGRWLALGLSSLVAVTILVGAVSAPVLVRALRPATPVAGPVDLSGVVEDDELDSTHADGPVIYDQVPPLGGRHAPVWWECGRYDEPVVDELAVHSLEHGTVWLTYDPDLSTAEVDDLAAALPERGILSPYPGLDTPVVVSVWGRQLALAGADDPRLDLFLEEYGDGGTAPEPFASCQGGVDDPGDVPDGRSPATSPGGVTDAVAASSS